MRQAVVDELLTFIFGRGSHSLAAPMTAWLNSSRRFTDFVNTYHTKIRKKIRTAQDPESLGDLQIELETAYLLLRERSLSVAYETHHPRHGRSPDFAVSYTTSLVFMVEVTRLRATQPRSAASVAAPLPEDRFSDMVCSKLGQFLPQHSNVLLVGLDAPHLTQSDINAVLLRIQQRAEGNDPAIVQRHEFRDRADFIRHYQRLSALLVRGTQLQAGDPVIFWVNTQAKVPFPSKVRTALLNSHTL